MEEQINRVDRTTSLGIGIATGITALWCGYRLIWLLYAAVTFSSVGWSRYRWSSLSCCGG